MTRFTVVWTTEATDELARIWNDSVDRAGVSAAAAAIDIELANDAGAKGVPLSEGLRKPISPPLVAVYCVREADRIADVGMIGVLHDTGAV